MGNWEKYPCVLLFSKTLTIISKYVSEPTMSCHIFSLELKSSAHLLFFNVFFTVLKTHITKFAYIAYWD
jgi:hypothetical protein